MVNMEIVQPYVNRYSNADIGLQTNPSHILAMREVLMTSTVSNEFMSTASFFNTTFKMFPTLSPPKHMCNSDYAAIKEVPQLLIKNAASVKSDLIRGQNRHLGIVIPPKKYN